MLSKSSDNRNRGLRGRKNHASRFLLVVLVACLSTVAVFALAACSSSDGDNASPHVDNGKLRIYYEEPYEIVPKGSFYHEKGFGMFLEVYSSLFSSKEVSGLDSTFLVSGEEEDHIFRSLSMFSEVDDGDVSSQDVKSVIDNFTLPRPEMTDPRFRLVDDIDKGNGESILIYAVYEKADKNKAAEMRVASYFWSDRLIGVGLTYLGPVEGEDRAQEVALAENMLRNVEIIH